MTSRIDELFSPEKLRLNWQAPKLQTSSVQPLASNVDVREHFYSLLQLIRQTFPDVSCLSVRFDELSALIDEAYPLNLSDQVLAGPGSRERIVEKLEQLDELLWALSLPNRERRR